MRWSDPRVKFEVLGKNRQSRVQPKARSRYLQGKSAGTPPRSQARQAGVPRTLSAAIGPLREPSGRGGEWVPCGCSYFACAPRARRAGGLASAHSTR